MADRLALIIANSDFDDPRLTRLAMPSRDAEALAYVLRDPEIGGFYVTVLLNKTQRVVRREIARLYQRRMRDDLVLLYYSGHGFKDDFGDLYLAVRDTEKDVLGATAIEATFVRTQMDRSSSQRKVVMLDCCHSGAFARGAKAVLGTSAGAREAFAGTGYGRVILTASNALEFAWEGDQVLGEAVNSVFTHFLVQGLRTGAADLNSDGQIALSELYEYVYDQVLSSGVTQQTPEMWAEKVQGEIRIAWNPHRQRQEELERLYQGAEASVKNRAWAEAVDLCQRIQALQPGYREVAALLRQAQDGLRQDEAEREQQAKLSQWYEQAEAALQQGRWQRVKQLVTEIEALEPGYRDVRHLQEQAEAGLRREQAQQRIKAQLNSLYEKLQTAAQQEDWAEVFALGGQIQALDPAYRDVPDLMEWSRTQMRRRRRTPLPAQASTIAVAAGILAVVAVALVGIWLVTRGGAPPSEMENEEVSAFTIERPKDWKVQTVESAESESAFGFTYLIASAKEIDPDSFGSGSRDFSEAAPLVLIVVASQDMGQLGLSLILGDLPYSADALKSMATQLITAEAPDAEVVRHGDVTVDGVRGYELVYVLRGEAGESGSAKMGFHQAVFERESTLLAFVAISLENNLDKNLDIFKYMLESVRFK